MTILLTALNASYVHTNAAVRCIASVLAARGETVRILERSLKDRTREILHELYAADADVYGFSVYIWNRDTVLALASQLRLLRPAAKIVLGGPEISYEDESFFAAHPYIDNILAGEGETVFPAFLDNPPPRHTILCGEPYGDFVNTGILYDLYPPGAHSGGILYYESARGCPYRCSYCLSSAHRGVRAKSADVTIGQLREFEKMDNVRIIKFVDRTFNFDRRRADQIWRALAGAEFTKTYHFEICADLLDEENFAVLAAVPPGKIQLECGVQSTNPATLAAIGRTSDPAKILAALARIRKMRNIHLHADLIAGLPHEGWARFAQSFDETFPVCHKLQLGFLKLLPGTSLRRDCESMGFAYSPRPPYEILHSDALSYEELYRLHGIDDVLDRFSTDGKFAYTMEFLLEREPSPFAFFAGLAESIPPLRALSQREAVLALREFALCRGADAERLDARLTLDWMLSEAGSPPYPLTVRRAPKEAGMRREYCEKHPETKPGSFAVLQLADLGTVQIDRTNHTVLFETQPNPHTSGGKQ